MVTAMLSPQWTAPMYPPKVGRDHLGLGSVSSDQILPSLVPGINVLTFHPRYHSLYAFLLDEFWRRELPRTRRSWVTFFRPRDYIFCLGAFLCQQPEHGEMRNIVGGQQTLPVAQQRLDTYTTDYQYIKSDLGGYGLYYRSAMIELELVYPGGPGFPYLIDVPSETGKQLATAFRASIQDTDYYRTYFDDASLPIPRAVIEEYIHQACLCQLPKPSARDRALLQTAFLNGGNAERASARRKTLQFMLDLTQQTQGHAIDTDHFRQLLFYRATDDGAQYSPSASCKETYLLWRLYQAREYYAFALNTLWRHLCDWGLANMGDVRPLAFADFHQHLKDSLDFAELASYLGIDAPRLNASSDLLELFAWLKQLINAEATTFDSACDIGAPVNEHRLYSLVRRYQGIASVEIAGMVTLLAALYLRFSFPELWTQTEWQISRMGAEGRLSLDRFIQAMRRQVRAGSLSLLDLLRWLYDEYIILQHHLIAANKMPDNTYRFQREGNKLRFFNLEAHADFLDSRYDAMATTISELGFCGDPRGADHELTPEGERLLVNGELS